MTGARPIVFLGPSAPRDEILRRLPDAQIVAPITRDDLYRAREAGGRTFLIIDGSFGHRLAVSPREIVDVVRDGARVIGAASMGALRAAECWPAGMRGEGLIYQLYRRGLLDSDDEVAVATDPDRGHAAVSVALINVRHAVSRALRAGKLARDRRDEILEVARGLFFADRRWSTILARAGGRDERLEAYLGGFDRKRDDALLAADRVAALLRGDSSASAHARRTDAAIPRTRRYPGHDRLVGVDEAALRLALTRWLVGSGRYQRYVWAIAASEPELADLPAAPVARAEALRDRLALVLARWSRDLEAWSQRLWAELELLDELDAEIMRWHAARELGAAAGKAGIVPASAVVTHVRHAVAIAHGVRDWGMLEDNVEDGLVFRAIPLAWIEEACAVLAAARAFAGR